MTAPVPDHAALPAQQLRVTPPHPVWSGGPEDFWTCDDWAERLSTTEFEEAVTEFVDGFLAPGCDTEKILREKVAPLEVYGYSRAAVTDSRLELEADDLVDHLAERLSEDEWGDPDGRHDVLSSTGRALLKERFAAALRSVRAHIVPWHCEVTKTVVLEADELVALVRRLEPEWFEAEVSRG